MDGHPGNKTSQYALCCVISLLVIFLSSCKEEVFAPNLALCLDGKDNRVCIGMGILRNTWTLEAWIKGDDMQWKDTEVIVGGGEYSRLKAVDAMPLLVKDGKLHSTKAGLWSETTLDDQWHHVAVVCDGYATTLFLDGKAVDRKETATAILPGVIGGHEKSEETFGGCIDEVRIWTTALTEPVIHQWMGKALSPSHPSFNELIGYYPFDDALDDMSVNWVGKGYLAFHVRNGRNERNGRSPLARTVINDNARFKTHAGAQKVFNAVVIDSEWDADQGTTDDPILKIRIAVTGTTRTLHLKELALDLSETTELSDLSCLHVYYTGSKAKSDVREEWFATAVTPGTPGVSGMPDMRHTIGTMIRIDKKIILKAPGEGYALAPGINYLLVTADISDKAVPGNKIKIKAPSFKLNHKSYRPEPCDDMHDKRVGTNSRCHPDVLRVLQWNIWHGGVHLGDQGVQRVIELIQAVDPDVVTMQEAYGSQQVIADSLGFYLQTPSPKDNLALFSRYPIAPLPSSKTFQSNPGKITLANGRDLLVNSCWLRYAYRPEYTASFPDAGHNTDRWIAEDSVLALADIRHILSVDVEPVEQTMPVIIAGDFNACSHLDWTAAAAHLHYGYGPVSFPVSRFMQEKGYHDSFRELHPDETKRPEGTFAIIYGHLQNARIDYIYYKGTAIRAIASKIIRTTPEIDSVWPSDHEAVVTTFQVFGIK